MGIDLTRRVCMICYGVTISVSLMWIVSIHPSIHPSIRPSIHPSHTLEILSKWPVEAWRLACERRHWISFDFDHEQGYIENIWEVKEKSGPWVFFKNDCIAVFLLHSFAIYWDSAKILKSHLACHRAWNIQAKRETAYGEKPEAVKTHLRNMVIVCLDLLRVHWSPQRF